MGCVASRIDKDERVRNCRERKRLMKQLLAFRGHFADAHVAYLRGLKNVGITLNQFTDSDQLDNEVLCLSASSPPRPRRPPPLPPAPPTPPLEVDQSQVTTDQINQTADSASATNFPAHLTRTSSWSLEEYWNPFREEVDRVEDENWAETKMEFEEDEVGSDSVQDKSQTSEVVDDNLSSASSITKYTDDMPVNKLALHSIVKDLDDYFLKAWDCGREIAVFMVINKGDTICFPHKENKRKRSSSAKVFNALSWSWSFKSSQSSQGASDSNVSGEPCRPGAHCITLERLHAAEQKLYKELKEEEMAKLERERKSMLLQKLVEENNNWSKIEKTRSSVENLESYIGQLQSSIKETCSSILELINGELYPQLVALVSGLKHIWRKMYGCHQKQKNISLRLNYLNDIKNMDFTSVPHHKATAQLVTEVTYWYNSFCMLTKSQQDYIKSLSRWVHLTNCLVDSNQQTRRSLSVIRKLCEEWQHALEKLPEQAASEAIKSFLSDIQAIFQQQKQELNLLERKTRLERRLQKESDTLVEMERRLRKELSSPAETEKRLEGSSSTDEIDLSTLSPRHPVSAKRSKIQALEVRVQAEQTRYLNSIQDTKTMTLDNLKKSLPNVFQALLEFSAASAWAFEQVYSNINLNSVASASSSRSVEEDNQMTQDSETTVSSEVENSTN